MDARYSTLTSKTRKNMQINKKEIFVKINQNGDRTVITSLILYFIFGITISYFYNTTLFAFIVGGLTLFGYFFTKIALPKYNLYKYYASAAYAIFMAQFIYQMHGMFEMHFFAFIGAIILICYQDWRLQIPNILVVLVHHATLAWMQYNGADWVFFTQLEYMDLQAFIFHASLAAVIVTLAGYWCYVAEQQTLRDATNLLQLQNQLSSVEKNVAFAEEIKKGNYDIEYQLQTSDDRLGKALLEMRDSLITAKIREDQEKYINIGLAKINDILRSNINNIDRMCNDMVLEISKYLNANQAGMYLLEDTESEQYLELKAHYAYNRKKFVEKRIEIGEGLVGQVYLEKEYALLTNLPDGYMTITSGLGHATPACLILVPILSDEVVVGIFEIASFNVFDKSQISFLEKASEAIGATIVSSKLAQRTKHLLEDAQQQSEELKSQEEEMRQNLEELTSLQEESYRSSKNFEARFEALANSNIALAEFTPKGIIINTNDAFNTLMGYKNEEIIGKHHRIFVSEEYATSLEYQEFWKNLADGQLKSGNFYRVTKNGTKIKIKGGYSTIKSQNGEVESIIKFAVLA